MSTTSPGAPPSFQGGGGVKSFGVEAGEQGGLNGECLWRGGSPEFVRRAPEFVRRPPNSSLTAPEFVPNGPFFSAFFFYKKITQKSEIWPKKAKFDLI